MKNELEIDTQTVHFTVHALDRYRERVKPILSRDGALIDLLRMKDHAYLGAPPQWAEDSREGLLATSFSTWLFYGEDVAFPLDDKMAITCIARGSISDETRVARNEIRASLSENKKSHRRHRAFHNALNKNKRRVEQKG